MADISQVKLPNGDTYNLVDETSGYIKSYTDEKLKTNIMPANNQKYLIAGSASTTAETKYYNTGLSIQESGLTGSVTLIVGADEKEGAIKLINTDIHKAVLLSAFSITDDRIITLPDQSGTIALTSDIPSVYSSTNTGGYLTMATLPIYDGTVVQI